MSSLIALKEDESESMLPRNSNSGLGVQQICWGPYKKAGSHAIGNRIWMSWHLGLGSIYKITFSNFYCLGHSNPLHYESDLLQLLCVCVCVSF